LARRSADGSAATPDIARLKGARLVTVPEPGLDLNIALIKQLTGGDKYTARFEKYFQGENNKSAVLNWMVEGYRLLLKAGFEPPSRVTAAVEAYRSEEDIVGAFLSENTLAEPNGRIATSALYSLYSDWAKAVGYKPLSNRSFTIDIRRHEIWR